jgi:hypothetical protein
MKKIEDLIDGMKCPKDFECYKMGFEKLCEAEDFGLSGFLRCMDKNPDKCKFSAPYGSWYLCDCPLRIYIAKQLKK